MAMLQQSLGDIGRVGLKKIWDIEAARYDDQVKLMLGNIIDTKQTFERFKTVVGLGPSVLVPEGEIIPVDDKSPLYVRNFTPVKYGKAVQYSVETAFVDQYRQIAELQPELARAFMLKRNLVAAGIYNNGFTDTTSGANSEVLFSTAHSMNGVTASNRPAVDLAFGPLAVAQARSEIRQQKSARGQIMPYTGEILFLVPPALDGLRYSIMESDKMPTTNNNDANYARNKNRIETCDYLTSPSAWFARVADDSWHKLFFLKQMPYTIEKLPLNQAAINTWIAFESYVAGWMSHIGTWGTVGA